MKPFVTLLLMFGSWLGGVLVCLMFVAVARDDMQFTLVWGSMSFVLAMVLFVLFVRQSRGVT